MDGRDGMFIVLEAAADVQFRFHKYSTRNSQPLRQIVGSSFAKNTALKRKKISRLLLEPSRLLPAPYLDGYLRNLYCL